MRLLEVKNIPENLLKNDKLYLPGILIDSWESILKKHDLIDIAKVKSVKRSVGGKSLDETKEHLAHRYNGSSARNLLSIIDPKSELFEISNIYIKLFSGGSILLFDLPCGSGAGVVSILTTFYELRENNVLPRDSININILCCDISQDALDNTKDQLNYLKTKLVKQAINIDFNLKLWDITSDKSTEELINTFHLVSQKSDKFFVTINNFSGFLDQGNNWDLSKEQINDIFINTRIEDTTVIWIEPLLKQSSTLFKRFFEMIKNIGKSKSEKTDIKDYYGMSTSHCFNHFFNKFFKIRLTIGKAIIPKGDKYE